MPAAKRKPDYIIMDDLMTANQRRATAALWALNEHESRLHGVVKGVNEAELTALLTNLMHWCVANRIEFAPAIDNARVNFATERLRDE